jgi:hypothetical protein
VGDVVEDVVSREASRISGESARDQLVAELVVIEHPGRQPDRRVRDGVQRLRAVRHLVGIAHAGRKEVLQDLVGLLLIAGETVWLGTAGGERLRDLGRNGRRHVGVNAQQSFGRQQSQLLGDGIAPVAALGDVAGVPEALHQHDPGLCDADRVPTGNARLA